MDLNNRKVTEFEDNKKLLIENFISKNKDHFNPGNLTLISKLKK